jgi:hypothetical protein
MLSPSPIKFNKNYHYNDHVYNVVRHPIPHDHAKEGEVSNSYQDHHMKYNNKLGSI